MLVFDDVIVYLNIPIDYDIKFKFKSFIRQKANSLQYKNYKMVDTTMYHIIYRVLSTFSNQM